MFNLLCGVGVIGVVVMLVECCLVGCCLFCLLFDIFWEEIEVYVCVNNLGWVDDESNVDMVLICNFVCYEVLIVVNWCFFVVEIVLV